MTRDGRHVVFMPDRTWRPNIWRTDLDGGNQKQLTDGVIDLSPHVSPDGKQIACSFQEDASSTTISIAVVAAEGGPPLKTFPLPGEGQTDSNVLRWTSDLVPS